MTTTKYVFRLKIAEEPDAVDTEQPTQGKRNLDLSFSKNMPEGGLGQDVQIPEESSFDFNNDSNGDSNSGGSGFNDQNPSTPEPVPEPTIDEEAKAEVLKSVKKLKAEGITDIQSIRDKLYEEGWEEDRLWELFDGKDDDFDDVAKAFENA